jgi:hypothetical protein
MRRYLSYANIAATLALVFAMSGGALAAKHYLLNSTKQISPPLLKKLRGRSGSTGPTGPTGPRGERGFKGEKGPKGEIGAPGSARAYGVINSKGEAVPLKTRNLTSLKIGTGSYCVVPAVSTGIDPDDVPPVVTADQDDGTGLAHIAETRQADTNDFAQCAGGWVFTTYSFEGGEWKPADIAFSVVVP